jgi:superfamily II DNA or RNA helicase
MLEVLDHGSTKANLERVMIQTRRMAGSKVPLIFAVNYESIWRKGLDEALLKWQPDLLVMEESHKIKAPGGKASRYIGRLGMRSKQRCGLTGTLMPNSQLDVYGQFRALDPGIFGTSFSRFRDEYAHVYDHNGVPIIQYYKNQKQLAEKIAPITVQVESKVLKLPEPIHDSRMFDLTPSERKIYDEIEQEYCTETEQGYLTVTNGLTKILRLQQLTGGWLPLREDNIEAELKRIGKSKQDLLRDLLEDIPSDEPVVIFARFTADLDSVKEVAAELKRPYGEISGRAYDKGLWDQGKVINLGINVKSGEGIDTLKKARYGIFYSVGYSNGEFEQCVGRLRRPGMRDFCYFYHLVARNTVDIAVYKALKAKQSIRDQVIGYLREHAKAA